MNDMYTHEENSELLNDRLLQLEIMLSMLLW